MDIELEDNKQFISNIPRIRGREIPVLSYQRKIDPISVPMWDKRCYIRNSSQATLLYTRQLTRDVHVKTFQIIIGRRTSFAALGWENADSNFQTLVTSLLVNKNLSRSYLNFLIK